MSNDLDRYKRLLENWSGEPPKEAEPAPAAEPEKSPAATGPEPRPARMTPTRATAPTPIPSPPSRQERAAAPTGSAERAKLAPRKSMAVQGQIPSGTLLSLDDSDVVIYRRPVAGKGLDMVYSLMVDGSAVIEAITLAGRRVEKLGRLEQDSWDEIQEKMAWRRETLVKACGDSPEVERLPEPREGAKSSQAIPPLNSGVMSALSGPRVANPAAASGAPTAPTPPPASPSPQDPMRREAVARAPDAPSRGPAKLRRGQRVTLKFGGKMWHAVYWGRDSRGSVVAHDTLRRWTLMHLDLDQYKDSLVIESEPDEELIQTIAQQIQATLTENMAG